jgi:hypothetical protein
MILKKMARGVRSVSKKPETSLHHYGLIKLLVVHALKTQGGSWKQFLQQSFAQQKSKSIETQEVGTHSESSSRKAKKDMESEGKEDIVAPNFSQLIKKSVTEKFVMGESVISRKKIATQFQRVSFTSIQRGERQKEGLEPCGQSNNVPKKIMEVPSEPASQIEKTPDFQLQRKKNSTPAEASSSVLHPKDQRSQNKKQKKETDQ